MQSSLFGVPLSAARMRPGFGLFIFVCFPSWSVLVCLCEGPAIPEVKETCHLALSAVGCAIDCNVEFQALWLPILLYAALGARPLAPQSSSQVSVAHSDQVAPRAFSAATSRAEPRHPSRAGPGVLIHPNSRSPASGGFLMLFIYK